MINNKMKIYIYSFVFFVVFLIFTGLYLTNRDYNKVFFINDNAELIKKYISSTPIKIEINMKFLPTYILTNPEDIIELWKKVLELPTYNYISTQTDNSENVISGYIYFLDGGRKEFEFSNNLIINNLTYGTEDEEYLVWIKEKLMNMVFSVKNLSRVFLNSKNKIIIFNHERGTYLNETKKLLELYKIIENSVKIESAEKIGKILQNSAAPLYKIKVLRDNIEFLRLNIYDGNHFSVYYMNTFLYLLEGNLLPFLKSVF